MICQVQETIKSRLQEESSNMASLDCVNLEQLKCIRGTCEQKEIDVFF